ncbi:glycoside hydrolase family 3 N-terminal domain-containing protein [Enterococcus sp. OL5]|uniref:glycoside hydrolase family 3 N-terminal domain-containing protein n=1 Tax=Enterococcus sp. OL5 TaxID=2590214 RepID=UPI001127CD55|nr:glycoside hydrolase family 3 N-terminal domain-containing protein [Enterococcus sp. OL5]TPR55568.1 beta-glucosidase [Enterococcus sp. OL5]
MTWQDTQLSSKERAEKLLEELSIEEKMAQIVGFLPQDFSDMDALRKNCPKGIGEISLLEMRRLTNLKETARYQKKMQEEIMKLSPHQIPAIFHMEGLSGAYLPQAMSFATGIARGATFNPTLEYQVGLITAQEERAVGITHTFAPVLDINLDPRFGRQGEAYGEDANLVAQMGVAYTQGLQSEVSNGKRTEAVAKHFLASHASEGGIHGTQATVSNRTLREKYGKPFQAAMVLADLKGVMPCYSAIDNEPPSVSKALLTDLLKQEMGFEGLVVSDYSAISNVHTAQKNFESLTETGYASLSAGMAIELPNATTFNEELGQWFEQGRVPIAVLDQAVLQVLEAKFRMGLFEAPFALPEEELSLHFGQSAKRETAKAIASQSFVLLKNNGLLPLKPVTKIAVIGCHADTARTFYGGYSHFSMAEGVLAAKKTMAGVAGIEATADYEKIPGTPIQVDSPEFEALFQQLKPDERSLIAELKFRMPDSEILTAYGYDIAGTDTSHFAEALAVAQQADVVIVTLGGKYGTSMIASTGEGIDSTSINLPWVQEQFLEALAKINVKTIGIHFDGRPISSDRADQTLDALIEAWNPGDQAAAALVDTLIGVNNPSGRLPVSVVYVAGQVPVYHDHLNGAQWHQAESVGFTEYLETSHHPRYPFGYGLSYSQFAYADFKLNKQQFLPHEAVEITVTVTNTSERAGCELVQLYVSDEAASMTRPHHELAGFLKVSLQPQEAKTVVFTFYPSQVAFINRDNQWLIEKGMFRVMLGTTAENIVLTERIEVLESAVIDGKTRAFYAEAHVMEEKKDANEHSTGSGVAGY